MHLAVTRYIDPDEFAFMHWTYLLLRGHIPYRDFFINFTPVYFWLLMPIVALAQSSTVVIAARLFQLLLIAGIAIFVFRLTVVVSKNTITGLIACLLFLVFPMTFDKTIEVRPDTGMTLLFVIALCMLVETQKIHRMRAFIGGIFLGLSIAMVVKIVYGLPAFALLLFVRSSKKELLNNSLSLVTGFLIPLVAVGATVLASGTTHLAWENIVHGSLLIKQGEGAFSPFKAWSPYPLVYVNDAGISLPWLFNCCVWLSAIGGIVVVFRKHVSAAWVITCVLVLGILSLFLFPTPYLQYFIPLSVFVSMLSAMFIMTIISALSRSSDTATHSFVFPAAITLVLALCMVSFWTQYRLRTGPGSDNAEQKKVIDDILTISKSDESVYDMVGSYIFRPDGYYICCNIYSQFASQLSIKLPSLADSLIAQQTKFIILDRGGKSLWLPLPDDLTFLKTHFLPSEKPKIYTPGIQFVCEKTVCSQRDVNGDLMGQTHSFTIEIAESYKIKTKPGNETVLIDGQKATEKTRLSRGPHTFAVGPTTALLSVQLDR
jgi:hypothetical protein